MDITRNILRELHDLFARNADLNCGIAIEREVVAIFAAMTREALTEIGCQPRPRADEANYSFVAPSNTVDLFEVLEREQRDARARELADLIRVTNSPPPDNVIAWPVAARRIPISTGGDAA